MPLQRRLPRKRQGTIAPDDSPEAKFESAGHDHGDRTHNAKRDEGEDLRTITKVLAGRELALRWIKLARQATTSPSSQKSRERAERVEIMSLGTTGQLLGVLGICDKILRGHAGASSLASANLSHA